MILLLSLGVFVITTVLTILLNDLLYKDKETIEKRLLRYVKEGKKISLYDAKMEEPFFKRVIEPTITSFIQKMASLAPDELKENLERKIFQAGYPFGLTVEQFLSGQFFLVVIFPLLVFIFFLKVNSKKAILLGIIFLLSGLIFPEYLLRTKIRERAQKMQESLPDFLDLLTVSVEAGLGFDAALSKVIEKTPGQLSLEFKRLLNEIRMGKPRGEAFKDLAQRSIIPDLATFCSAIIQAEQLGVSIGKVLRVQSQQMRLKRRQRAEEAAMKAPIKMLFPLILLIFPALFIILLGPAVIRLIQIFGGI